MTSDQPPRPNDRAEHDALFMAAAGVMGPQPSEPKPGARTDNGTPPPDTPEVWRIFGLLISRKIDVVAFAAFFLSIATIVIQLSAFLKGAELKLLPPDQIFIQKDDSYTDGVPRARFGATLIYVNKGEKGYAAIVRRETVDIVIGGKKYEQGWDEFVTFDGFTPTKGEPAKPFSVDGGDSKSHQTYFIPWPKRCSTPPKNGCDVQENHVPWDQFINELKRLVQAGKSEFEFEFVAEVIDHQPRPAFCKIEIDAKIIEAIDLQKGYNPTCFEVK